MSPWYYFKLEDRTNHLGRDGVPTGANLLYMDGHAKWKHFNDMTVRYIQDGWAHQWW